MRVFLIKKLSQLAAELGSGKHEEPALDNGVALPLRHATEGATGAT